MAASRNAASGGGILIELLGFYTFFVRLPAVGTAGQPGSGVEGGLVSDLNWHLVWKMVNS
jgi:hypothetical protein